MKCKLTYTRAFVRKVRSFQKYYPLISKNPDEMIKLSLDELTNQIHLAKDESQLEPISEVAKSMTGHTHIEELFQFEVIGEPNRYIIFRPLTCFYDTDEVEVYDLLYIPKK